MIKSITVCHNHAYDNIRSRILTSSELSRPHRPDTVTRQSQAAFGRARLSLPPPAPVPIEVNDYLGYNYASTPSDNYTRAYLENQSEDIRPSREQLIAHQCCSLEPNLSSQSKAAEPRSLDASSIVRLSHGTAKKARNRSRTSHGSGHTARSSTHTARPIQDYLSVCHVQRCTIRLFSKHIRVRRQLRLLVTYW